MADIANLVVQMEMQSAQFQTQMSKVNSQLGALDRRTKQSSASMGKLGASMKTAGKAALAYFGARAVVQGFSRLVNNLDSIAKSAPKIGLTTKALQELQYAAGLAGVDAKGLQGSMLRLSVNMLDAERGVKEMEQAFKALGVAGEKDAMVVLGAIADRFAQMPDGAQKSAEASKLFGRSAGPELINLLNQGSKGIEKYAKELNDLGGVIDNKTLKASENLKDSLSRLGTQGFGIAARVLSLPIQWLSFLADQLIKVLNLLRELGDWVANTAFFKNIVNGFKKIAGTVGEAFKSVKNFLSAFSFGVQSMPGLIEVTKRIETLKKKFEDLDAQANSFNNRGLPVPDSLNKQIKSVQDELEKAIRMRDALQTAPIEIKGTGGTSPDDKPTGTLKPLFTDTTNVTNALKAEADALTKSIDVVGEYTAQIERLNLMREKGYITDNIYEEQLFRLQDALDEATTGTAELADKTVSLSEEMKVAAGNLISGAISGLVDLFFEANQSFQQFASNFLKEIAKMIAQVVIFNALKTAAAGTSFAGFFGAKGMQLGGASGLPHGVYNTPTRFNLPNKFEGGELRSGMNAFARGGVLGEAGPEAILPLSRGANGKLGVTGSSTVVNVINNSGQEVKTSEQNTPDGGKIIDVIIGRKVQEMFANGSLDKMMRGVYGARRQAM